MGEAGSQQANPNHDEGRMTTGTADTEADRCLAEAAVFAEFSAELARIEEWRGRDASTLTHRQWQVRCGALALKIVLDHDAREREKAGR